jgi:2-methylcitrate dehydratase PrpD
VTPLASQVAEWVASVRYEDLPVDVVSSTKLRILDVLGLALAGAETSFGRSTIAAAVSLSPPGPARIFGSGNAIAAPTAAFANASLSQALEYDDTHNESIVHMSSPAVAASLALADLLGALSLDSARDGAEPVEGPSREREGGRAVTGRDLILSIAVANEISCRVGSVSSGQFHRRGFHPTGLFAPFGIAAGIGKMLGLDAQRLAWAEGTAGSCAAGLLECWVDGTQTKFLHSGFAAQSGLTAALLAHAGVSGPPNVFEGRFGLFASHLQDPATPRSFGRIADRLGSHWESRNSSFKPFPTAHVLHPYVSAILRVRNQHGVRAADVVRIECPVAEFNVSIVCEPVAEKCAPATQAHCRVCLQYTMAEALYSGGIGKNAYSDATRLNPEVLALARKVDYVVDPSFPGPGRFKGAVKVTLKDGRVIEEVEEYNRGSEENPMSEAELRAKFDDNASGFLSAAQRDRLAQEIARAENLSDVRTLVDLSCRAGLAL